MKKLLFLTLGVLIAIPALARDFKYEYEGQTITYTVVDEDAKTCKTRDGNYNGGGNSVSGKLVLPVHPMDGDTEFTLISLGYDAFYNCKELTSIELPNSVIYINSYALSGCTGLTELTIPNSVTYIGSRAFRDCTGLTEITLADGDKELKVEAEAFSGVPVETLYLGRDIKSSPFSSKPLVNLTIGNSVTYIHGRAFYGCTGLTELTIPNSVTSIGYSAFYDCSGLTNLIIGNSVTSIGESAFHCCSRLTELTIPNSVTTIDREAFYGCSSLTEITLADGEKELKLNDNAFFHATVKTLYLGRDIPSSPFKGQSLVNLTIGNSVTGINYSAFERCSSMTNLTIGNSVAFIGYNAFKGCSSLNELKIPNSVTAMGDEAFSGCSSLKEITLADGEENLSFYRSVFKDVKMESLYIGRKFTNEGGATEAPFYNKTSLTNLTISNSITEIPSEAFQGCTGLTDVTVSWEVPPTINFSAKAYENALLTVNGGNSLDYFGGVWGNFTNISYNGHSIKKYSDDVLTYRLFKYFETPEAIVVNGDYSNLTTLSIPERITDTSDPENPVRYYVTAIAPDAFKGRYRLTQVNFNNRSIVKSIGNNAFRGTSLSAINLPATVEEIGTSSFYNTDLKSFAIPEKVTALEDSVFYNCTKLTGVTLNTNLISIGRAAFSMDKNRFSQDKSCGSLHIPSSLKSIGADAFLYRVLNKVVIDDLRAWCDIDFANNDSNPCGWANEGTWIGDNQVVDLVIPAGVTEIKPFSFVIVNRTIKSVSIPYGVTSIGEEAFYMQPITTLSIPASVNYIGSRAFICWRYESTTFYKYLTSLTLEDGVNPIEIASDAFEIPTSLTKDKYTRYNTPTSFYMGRPMVNLPKGFSETLRTLIIGNAVEELSTGMFADFRWINSIKLSANLKSVSERAFAGCSSIKEVIVPPMVESIGEGAFDGANALESIIMGHNVKTIGANAFNNCPAKTVSITAQTPPTAPNNTFSSYTGKLWLQDPGDESVMNAYYDAFTCWDRFDSFAMVTPSRLEGDNQEIIGKPGEQFQLTAKVWPENVTLPQVFWRSTNPEIATVDENGLVTLHADISDIISRSGDQEEVRSCKIIAETLYADGPLLEVTVYDESSAGIDEVITDKVEAEGIDYEAPYEVYNLNGAYLGNSLDCLARGFYIVRQGRAAKKIAL